MFIYTHPVYPRKPWEVFFKRMYNFLMVMNFATWIIVFMDYVSRINHTYEDYWSANGKFEMYKPLQQVLTNCTYTQEIDIDWMRGDTTVTVHSVPYMIMSTTSLVKAVFVMHGVMIGLDFTAKLMFALNTRNLRFRGLHVPLNQLLITVVFCLSIAIICTVEMSREQRRFFQKFVEQCEKEFKETSGEEYVQAEHDVKVVFGTVLDANMWLVIINMIGYFLGFLHLCSRAFTESNSRILQLDYPWEKGVTCKPNKPVLVQYTNERKQYEIDVMELDVAQQLRLRSEAAAIAYNPTRQKLSGEMAPEITIANGGVPADPTQLPPPRQQQQPQMTSSDTRSVPIVYEATQPQELMTEDDGVDVEDGGNPDGGEEQLEGGTKSKKHRKKSSKRRNETDEERRERRRRRRAQAGAGESEGDGVGFEYGDAEYVSGDGGMQE